MKEDILNQITEASIKSGYHHGVLFLKLGYDSTDPKFKACINGLIKDKLIRHHNTPTGVVLTALKND